MRRNTRRAPSRLTSARARARAPAPRTAPCATPSPRSAFPAFPLRPRCRRLAAPGPEVDDPVGAFDDVQVVLDDDHGVARVDQPISTTSSLLMSSKCRPVVGSSRMYSVRPVCAWPSSRAELDALGLAARQRGRWLPELHVARGPRPRAFRGCAEAGVVLEKASSTRRTERSSTSAMTPSLVAHRPASAR